MRAHALALAALATVTAAGCGDREPPRLVVSAASSLRDPLSACASRFGAARVRLSFAGSDELAAQIRRGVRPDVLAAANTQLPRRLASEGLLRPPVTFAGNELVLAVSPSRTRVSSLAAAAQPDVRLAIGAPSVPIGVYTSRALSGLPASHRRGILANVRSREPDVRGVVAKVLHGAVDAGFVYRTDVRAARGRLRAVRLPARARPPVAYGASVVVRARQPALARRYVAGLVAGPCAEALRAAGFAPPAR